MATNKIVVGLDNRVQSGEQSQAEIMAALGAQGVGAGVAEVVRDPITGKLIQVSLTFPDTANQAAIDAVNANRGVATATPPLPPPLFVNDLTGITAPALPDGASGTGAKARIVLHAMNTGAFDTEPPGDTILGILDNTNAYIDQTENDGGTYILRPAVILEIVNGDTVNDVVIAAGTITVTFDGGPLVIGNVATITVPKVAAGASNFARFWVGLDDKVYSNFRITDLVSTHPQRNYADAIAAGAV